VKDCTDWQLELDIFPENVSAVVQAVVVCWVAEDCMKIDVLVSVHFMLLMGN
jgi:hypothetical protein